MKNYEQLEIVLVRFEETDVICASDEFTGGWTDPNEEVTVGEF